MDLSASTPGIFLKYFLKVGVLREGHRLAWEIRQGFQIGYQAGRTWYVEDKTIAMARALLSWE